MHSNNIIFRFQTVEIRQWFTNYFPIDIDSAIDIMNSSISNNPKILVGPDAQYNKNVVNNTIDRMFDGMEFGEVIGKVVKNGDRISAPVMFYHNATDTEIMDLQKYGMSPTFDVMNGSTLTDLRAFVLLTNVAPLEQQPAFKISSED